MFMFREMSSRHLVQFLNSVYTQLCESSCLVGFRRQEDTGEPWFWPLLGIWPWPRPWFWLLVGSVLMILWPLILDFLVFMLFLGWLREAVDDPDEVFKKVILFPLLECEIQHKVSIYLFYYFFHIILSIFFFLILCFCRL